MTLIMRTTSSYLEKTLRLIDEGRCHLIGATTITTRTTGTIWHVDSPSNNRYLVAVLPDPVAGQLRVPRWSCTCQWARQQGYETKPCTHALACIRLHEEHPTTQGRTQ